MKKFILHFILSVCAMNLYAQKIAVLKDIKHGKASSFPQYLILAENKLFFSAEDSLHGEELWVSGGTRNTTRLLLDLNPGTAGSSPQNLIYMNGSMYFTANDGISGKELWKLNLANLAVKKLTNTSVSSPFGFEESFFIYNNELYFSFNDGIHGSEAWKTNGTLKGTVLVKDMRPGAINTSPRKFFIFKNKLFFLGEDDIDTQALYVINNAKGTAKKFFNCGEEGCSAFTVWKNKLYFFSDDQVFSSPNNELYASDGTTAGTHIIKQINPNGSATYFGQIAVANDRLLFAADDGVHGIELWKSDGTVNGTQMVKDIGTGKQEGVPTDMIVYKNKVIFQAYEHPASGATWITDGTETGTIKLSDILVSSSGKNFVEMNDSLLFVGYVNGHGFELCITDGTAAGTKLAYDINKGIGSGVPDLFTRRDSSLFFTANDDKKGYEIFSLSPVHFTASSTENNFEVTSIKAMEDNGTSLHQNSPNPFASATFIQYTLPAKYKTAAIVFADASGRVIKTIDLNNHNTNNGVMPVNAENFSPGIYFYSLVVDGRIRSTKKCIAGGE
ncbi:MAG TPA: T9SS type A sorting domain-containing protein [Parafilimonas sp.]|nr:T9SS type A sorting domain-containing protein [Parafilimonas sp.]